MCNSYFSVVSDMDLVCDKENIIPFVYSMNSVSVVIFSLIGSSVADRYGRRFAMIISSFGQFIFGIPLMFATDWWHVMILILGSRFIILKNFSKTILISILRIFVSMVQFKSATYQSRFIWSKYWARQNDTWRLLFHWCLQLVMHRFHCLLGYCQSGRGSRFVWHV